MKKLRTAIIGLGHQAEEDHIPGILDSQFAELVAICDKDENKLKEWQQKLNVNGYVKYTDMFNNEKLDFLVIAVPHDEYKAIMEEAIKRKIHILKEKPFAKDLKEAIYLKNLSEKNKVNIMTTLQRRFNPIYNSFFQLLEHIGDPFLVEIKYNIFVNNPHEGWRGSKEKAGGGCIIDMGYHMIDMLIWYFGLPDRVHAELSSKAKPEEKYDAEDTAIILFSYNSGLNGHIEISRYASPKTEFMKIIGTKGIIEINRGSIKRIKNNGEVAESLIREVAWPIASTNQIDYFSKIILGERENIGSPAYHLQHMAFIEACYQSKEKGMYIDPKELLK
jgi:predicted dehydrogenase